MQRPDKMWCSYDVNWWTWRKKQSPWDFWTTLGHFWSKIVAIQRKITSWNRTHIFLKFETAFVLLPQFVVWSHCQMTPLSLSFLTAFVVGLMAGCTNGMPTQQSRDEFVKKVVEIAAAVAAKTSIKQDNCLGSWTKCFDGKTQAFIKGKCCQELTCNLIVGQELLGR